MEYNKHPKNGEEISRLAYGCMRLPRDYAEAEREVLHAIERGINYFDTAYVYPGNEALLGKILESNKKRDSVNITTKFPHYLAKKTEDFEKMFQKQLERLNTDRVDYYLMHMLTSRADWDRLVGLGICEWLSQKQQAGQIRNVGFSFHGGRESFKDIVDARDWDICMIQYNYFDENNQAGREGLRYAASKGIPVAIMEPLRGGRLAGRLPDAARRMWEAAQPRRTPAEWALRWLWDQPEVFTVLSGMNSMEMIDQNIAALEGAAPGSLTEDERALFARAREIMIKATAVPCTGCNYCMPCPAGVDIPMCFSVLNDTATTSKFSAKFSYYSRAKDKWANKCVGCGKCEQHCPQSIKIREELVNVTSTLETFPYGLIKFVCRKFLHI